MKMIQDKFQGMKPEDVYSHLPITAKTGLRTVGIKDAKSFASMVNQLNALRTPSFGRRGLTIHQRKFKKAAKSCKGKRNYRSCMKKTLKKKKTVRRRSVVRRRSTVPGVRRKYTSGGGRKSPGVSATLYPIGTVRKGLDGNKWKIKKASNGVKRWSRM
jgi:hypothetical protein